MATGADVGPLGNANILPDADFDKVIDPDVLPDPGMVPDSKAPWGLDLQTRFHDHAATDFGTEGAQDCNTPAATR